MLVAIITARGGSKGLPGKNIKELCGVPLIAYTIRAAQESELFDKIVVSTDCKDIAKVSSTFGAEVLMRPVELAQDDTSSYDVVEHVLAQVGCEYHSFVLLQPTSPLRSDVHIKEAYQLFLDKGYSSLASITETEITPFKCFVEDLDSGSIQPLFSWDKLTMPRQKLPKTFLINGAIYICNIVSFLQERSFFSQKLGVYKMDTVSSIDIDNIKDFHDAEKYLIDLAI